jgi:hypothetical protein
MILPCQTLHFLIVYVVGGFLRVLWFPPPIKLAVTIKLKYY